MSNRNLRVSRCEWLRFKSEISPILKSIMQFSGGDSGGNESDRGFFNRKRLWANSPIIENKIKCDSDIKVVISLENRKTTLKKLEFQGVLRILKSYTFICCYDSIGYCLFPKVKLKKQSVCQSFHSDWVNFSETEIEHSFILLTRMAILRRFKEISDQE